MELYGVIFAFKFCFDNNAHLIGDSMENTKINTTTVAHLFEQAANRGDEAAIAYKKDDTHCNRMKPLLSLVLKRYYY